MWLITPIGFFSIIQEPGEKQNDTLTVRSQIRSDLAPLKLDPPDMGDETWWERHGQGRLTLAGCCKWPWARTRSSSCIASKT